MEQKIKQQPAIVNVLSGISDATRREIGQKISIQLDLMNDPRFKLDNFRAIEEQGVRSYTLSASNEEIFVSFTIEWKGGKP